MIVMNAESIVGIGMLTVMNVAMIDKSTAVIVIIVTMVAITTEAIVMVTILNTMRNEDTGVDITSMANITIAATITTVITTVLMGIEATTVAFTLAHMV